jgi:acetolactate synthase-1/2/3 large subunit
MLFDAWRLANSGEPGPVFVEIPVNLQLFPGDVDAESMTAEPIPLASPSMVTDAMTASLRQAATML